jgi:hypothetical protein
MNSESKIQVVLFSDPNFLAINILEILLSKNCKVFVVSDNEVVWKERIKNLANTSNFSVINTDDYKSLENFSYAVFCGGYINKKTLLTDFKKFNSNKNFGKAKTLAIFPFETFSYKNSDRIAISDNAGIIYTGDLMGPRIDLDSNLLLPTLICEMFEKGTLTLGVGEIFYPVFVADVAKTIVKWLLSFGPYGKEIFLLGRQLSSGDFWKKNLKIFPDLKIFYDTEVETRFLPKNYEIILINSNLNICFNETYKWLIQQNAIFSQPKRKMGLNTKTREKKTKSIKYKFLRPYVLSLLFLLILPVLTSLISGGLLYLSFRQFLSEKTDSAKTFSYVAKTTFSIGKKVSDIFSYIPLAGRIYKEMSYISLTGEISSDLMATVIPAAESGREIMTGILGTGIYDVNKPALQIKSSLDYMYQKISIFHVTTQDNANGGVYAAQQMLQLVDFNRLKTYTKEGGILISNLPSILGSGNPKNYLILFQNNMELRPTGGFIGSYGVANFGGGKMNGLAINDIYSADGQLKGHVEPPLPIKNYLNEANWWFRDSNWNPDFPTSAERAEWFLNKEMDQKVDGVIAVDLTPIKNIIEYTGSIFLPDYNLTISSNNFYEKTQEEAQANFFPGSRKKASFLTALSRTLISELGKMNSKNQLFVLKAFYKNLTNRHIQIYLHDKNSAEALNKLGWDGKMQTYSCGSNCFSDFFGGVEANVGVNKANYFVKREFDFGVEMDSQKIKRNLVISLENSANPALGLAGVYKTYLRVMVPTDAYLISVKKISGQNVKNLTPEITQEKGRQEVGVLVEVSPKSKDQIIFEWQNTLPEETPINSYGLYIRKQSGVGEDSLSIKFKGIGKLVSSPIFSLTQEGEYSYNTILDKDFFARLSWK